MTSRIGKWAGVALAMLTGGGLLYLAVPRTVAAFLALPGAAVMTKVQAGENIDRTDARALALSRQRALAWAESAASWSDLGYAELQLAYGRRTSEGRPDPALLERAMRSTENALRGSPTDSESWMRLAFLRYAADGTSEPAGQALAMAFMTGQVRPKQVSYRLDLAFRLWPALTSDDRRLVMQFLRNSWPYGHKEIVAAANSPARLGIIRAAFAAEPAMLATFEALSSRQGKRSD